MSKIDYIHVTNYYTYMTETNTHERIDYTYVIGSYIYDRQFHIHELN